MNINIIIDIKDQRIKNYIQASIEDKISTYHLIDYHNIQQAILIFKEINDVEELKSYKKKHFSEHSVIFIVKNSELTFEALEQYPLCFIRKDSIEEDMQKAIQLIFNVYHQIEKVITFKMGYSYIQLKSSQIMYIESLGHYLIVHTQSGTYQVRQKLSSIQKELSQSFQQIHKSFIVNQDYVLQKSAREIILKDQTILPIGRSYRGTK